MIDNHQIIIIIMLTITIERQELSKMVRDVKEQSGRRKGWVRCAWW